MHAAGFQARGPAGREGWAFLTQKGGWGPGLAQPPKRVQTTIVATFFGFPFQPSSKSGQPAAPSLGQCRWASLTMSKLGALRLKSQRNHKDVQMSGVRTSGVELLVAKLNQMYHIYIYNVHLRAAALCLRPFLGERAVKVEVRLLLCCRPVVEHTRGFLACINFG